MKNNLNRLVSAIMLSTLFFMTVVSLIGIELKPGSVWTNAHAWAGSLTLAGSAMHMASKSEWIKAAFLQPAKTQTKRMRQNLRTDVGLFISGAICAVTGVVWMINPIEGMNALHMVSGMIMIGLVGLHMLLHWQWLVNVVRQMSAPNLEGQDLPATEEIAFDPQQTHTA